jgi:hypothetical protein
MVAPEFSTPEILRLRSILEQMGPFSIFSETRPLEEKHYVLIGKIIQVFNYLELNQRRIIDAFLHYKKISTSHMKYGVYVDTSTITGKCMEGFRSLKLAEDTLKLINDRLVDIDYCRNFRNMLAHNAARRFPTEEAIVLFSKDEKEAIRRSGIPFGFGTVGWSILRIEDLNDLLKRISDHERWAAQTFSRLNADLEEDLS